MHADARDLWSDGFGSSLSGVVSVSAGFRASYRYRYRLIPSSIHCRRSGRTVSPSENLEKRERATFAALRCCSEAVEQEQSLWEGKRGKWRGGGESER